MGMDFELKDVMSSLGITKVQAEALDEIDGNKDNKIKEDVFSMAKKLLEPNSPEGHVEIVNNNPTLTDKVLNALNRVEDKIEPDPIQKSEKNRNVTEPKNVEIKPQDLDYSLFKKDKVEAYKLAERALNEVKDKTREHNCDFSMNPYTPDFEAFPRPEDFKQFKKDAFTAWERAVDAWVEDCKQDMVASKNRNLEGLANGLANRFSAELERGKFEMFTALGLTLQRVEELFYQVGGNLESLEVAVRKEASKTRSVVKENGEDVKAYVEEAVKTRVVDTENHKETQKIASLSDAISNNAVAKIMSGTKRNDVENLKNRIINSENITVEKKIELLTKLKDLVVKNGHISNDDIDEILRETLTL